MNKVVALKQFKETRGVVPAFVGTARGRLILVKLHEQGVWVKAKGKKTMFFVSWAVIYGFAVSTDAREKLKTRKGN